MSLYCANHTTQGGHVIFPHTEQRQNLKQQPRRGEVLPFCTLSHHAVFPQTHIKHLHLLNSALSVMTLLQTVYNELNLSSQWHRLGFCPRQQKGYLWIKLSLFLWPGALNGNMDQKHLLYFHMFCAEMSLCIHPYNKTKCYLTGTQWVSLETTRQMWIVSKLIEKDACSSFALGLSNSMALCAYLRSSALLHMNRGTSL